MPSRCSKMLTIGLDARAVHRLPRRGTGKNLVDLYTQVLAERPDWRVIAYHRGDSASPVASDRYIPRRIDMPGDRVDAWRRWRLPAAAWLDGVDLLHCPANLAPNWRPCPMLVTIHDLLPLAGPARGAEQMRRSIRSCVSGGRTIITPSRYTADQLVRRFNADPDRLVVNPWAADRAMRPVEDAAQRAATCARYGVSEPFILHLGAPDPRKNTAAAIEAYARLPQPLRRRWPMLVVGLNCPDHRAAMAALCRERAVADAVHLHGFAAEADMPALFSAAALLFYPSRAEGFGLPILDAWATRTAVLCGNATSLPEVGHDAAAYVDPHDTAAMAEGLARLLEDPTRCGDLCDRGERRLGQFTWPRTAERFIAAVEAALHSQGRAHRDAA